MRRLLVLPVGASVAAAAAAAAVAAAAAAVAAGAAAIVAAVELGSTPLVLGTGRPGLVSGVQHGNRKYASSLENCRAKREAIGNCEAIITVNIAATASRSTARTTAGMTRTTAPPSLEREFHHSGG